MKTALIVLDGWGIAKDGPGNCLSLAKKPFYDSLVKRFPSTELFASGNAVGLPKGAMGTSEVGHLHIGAGRIVWQPVTLVDNQIKNMEFFKNSALKKAFENAKKHSSTVHFMGLCSDGLVHSSLGHLFALLEMAKQNNAKKVFIHFFADGRDVSEKSAKGFVEKIGEKIRKTGTGKIATVCGRYYSMDRDNNFERTKKAFELLTLGKGHSAKSALEAIEQAYGRGEKTDYYIEPTAITENGKPIAVIKDNDSVVFFNTRTDRIRQLIKCFTQKKFSAFKRKKRPRVFFCSFVQSDKTISEKDCKKVFLEQKLKNNLGKTISKAKIKQLRVAETEKYAHVTYFFNSQVEKPYRFEERILVPSKKVKSFDLAPEMSANDIAEKTTAEIKKKKFGFVLVNFANTDLVGHSANIPAIVKAAETVDKCLKKIVEKALENGYTVLITADHGNAEEKLSKTGEKIPSHSTNRVPFILVSQNKKLAKARLKKNRGLIDVAPTALKIMGLKKPQEMTGKALF